MQFNMEVENTHNGESEQANSADDGQSLVALIREIMGREIEVLVIRTVEQVIVPTVGELVRKIVKEEIQSVERRLSTAGTRNYANEMTVTKERSLHLKFLNEVSVPVLTGKLIQGKGGNPINLALVDGTTGHIVDFGPESSAKVEILVLDASGDDNNECNWTHENFNNKIIRECDKKKPHFAKSINIYLNKGIGVLSNAKLGHDSNWMKSCKCRLGARIMESFRGIEVQEAWTESFMVSDSRGELYKKHYPPSLSDDIWRLENIGRDGAPCKRLNKKKICKVQDFLFLHSVDPQRLEQIASDGTKIWKPTMWKATVDHAQTCNIDDTNMYMYYPSTESKMGVIFDAVGGLKGIIDESHYVPIQNLSVDEKVSARELLLSAFENRNDITSFNDKASLLQKYPYRSTDVNVFTNPSIEKGSNGNDLNTSENIDGHFPSEPETGQLYVDSNLSVPFHDQSCQLSDFENINAFASTEPSTSSQGIIPCIRTSDHPNNKYYKKHKSPLLSDKVPRLVNIRKGGKIDKCLQENKIYTVQDFLIRLLIDPQGLRSIVNLGEKWEATVNNARACGSDSKMYCYISHEQKTGVIFDVFGQVLGLYSEGHYSPTSTSVLSENHKAHAQQLLASAYKNWGDVKFFDDMDSLQQYFTGLNACMDTPNSLNPEMVGESSSRRSNISFNSVSSTMDSFSTDDVEIMHDALMLLSPGSPFDPCSMFQDFDELIEPNDICNNGLTNEQNADEQSVATVDDVTFDQSMVVQTRNISPKRWKKLLCVSRWFSIRKMVSVDVGRDRKKRRVC